MYRFRNDARKFYQQIKRPTEGFKPGASSCKYENGNLVTDSQEKLRLYRFPTMLQDDDDNNTAFRDAPVR